MPWAWAFDTPYKWTKQIPSFFGGTRQGMAISWPGHIKDKGGIRWQFHHVIDIVPTILEVDRHPGARHGGRHRAEADRRRQHGLYLRQGQRRRALAAQDPVFRDDGRAGPLQRRLDAERRAEARRRGNCSARRSTIPASAFKFELYDVRHDWTQYTDVAAQNPAKVQEMTDLMFGEFAKYQVLPLDASVATRMVAPRPSLAAGRKVFTYSGEPITGIPDGAAPNLLNTSYTITADIDVPQGGAEGMIVTEGGRFGGYGLYLLKGKPVFTWNLLDLKRVKWEGPEALAPGKHTLESTTSSMTVSASRRLPSTTSAASAGRAPERFKVDGKVVATQTLERTIPLTLAVGRDLRHRLGHRHAGRRQRLSGAVRLHRQDRQADDFASTPPVLTDAGQEEADGGRTRGAGRELSRLEECDPDPSGQRRPTQVVLLSTQSTKEEWRCCQAGKGLQRRG